MSEFFVPKSDQYNTFVLGILRDSGSQQVVLKVASVKDVHPGHLRSRAVS